MKDKVIVALDVSTLSEAEALVKKLSGQILIFKVGSELFTACGPKVIEMIHKHKARVFLDLKFHDIPNTVAKAVKAASDLGVFMCNVHAQGGQPMMEGVMKFKGNMRVLAVTVLTSLAGEDLRELGVSRSPLDQVLHLARMAKASSLDGVVCSGWEAKDIRKACGPHFLIVTPGIRPAASGDDQKRVLTPQKAFQNGADFIVVGRPIIEASNPADAAEKILTKL
jgi:orotidine-5'-phosphate decarboxylase